MSFSVRFVGKPKAVAEALRIGGARVVEQMGDAPEPVIHGVKCAFEAACVAVGENTEKAADGASWGVRALVAGHISRGGHNALTITVEMHPLAE